MFRALSVRVCVRAYVRCAHAPCAQEDVENHVPLSCCALNFNQDRELYWVDPQDIQLKDERKCQEDAEGRILNTANLNRLVCSSERESVSKIILTYMYIFISPNHGSSSMNYSRHNIQQKKQTKKKTNLNYTFTQKSVNGESKWYGQPSDGGRRKNRTELSNDMA